MSAVATQDVTGVPTLTDDVIANREAPRQARRQVAKWCAEWGLTDHAEDLRLVLDELITNAIAVTPSGGSIRWKVQIRNRMLSAEVWDPSRLRPKPREPDLEARSGRGIGLIKGLGYVFGYVEDGDRKGKTVFARKKLAP